MASKYTESLIRTFVNQYGVSIARAIAQTNLFFPAVVAQLSVESANGTSGLSVRANNFGGIKGNQDNGILMDTTETDKHIASRAYFRKYANFDEFIDHYVSILRTPRYINGGVFEATSPEDQIKAMVKAGYSTMTPNAYLKQGVKDRIDATRDIYKIGKIGNISSAYAALGFAPQQEANPGAAAVPNFLWDNILRL